MRTLSASVVIGALMLIGALAAAADRSIAADPQIQLAADSGPTADKDTYTQKARDEMQAWQQKLHDFSENAKAQGQKAGDAAENGLNAAWTKTEEAAQRLQTASADGWERAKISFEQASRELADAWDRIRAPDK
jgi:hypothetical protein